MFKPIYQIASPMCDWRTVPKNVYDAPNELLRGKLPPIEYLRRIVIEVTEAELLSINTASQIGDVIENVEKAVSAAEKSVEAAEQVAASSAL